MDADARLVRLEILALEEAHVVAGDHRHVEFDRQAHRRRHEGLLVGALGAHQLEIEAVAEMALPFTHAFARGPVAAADQHPARFAVATGKHDQSAIGLDQPGAVDQGEIAMPAIRPGARHEARQVAIAFEILAEQCQSMRLAAFERIIDPDVATGDRLDAGLLGGRVELDQGEQVDLVGQRHRRHAGSRAGRHELIDADRRIDQRVLAVDVQMDKVRGHGGNERREPTG